MFHVKQLNYLNRQDARAINGSHISTRVGGTGVQTLYVTQ